MSKYVVTGFKEVGASLSAEGLVEVEGLGIMEKKMETAI